MKGIILAGGTGSRLYPITLAVSKQLLPVYDKPMIYYPLSILMLAGIREILIITNPESIELFRHLLGTGESLGIRIEYRAQSHPRGLADAFIVGEDFLEGQPCCLMLGDNLFYGHGLSQLLHESAKLIIGAKIFGYRVKDPENYGVAEFDERGKIIGLEEKPTSPRSHYAIPGIYFYDSNVCNFAKSLKPSTRGELEITDLNKIYLSQGLLTLEKMSRGIAWLDTGSYETLLQAGNFIEALDRRQGLKVACLEEIAFLMKFIDEQQVLKSAEKMKSSPYGKYLRDLISGTHPDWYK